MDANSSESSSKIIPETEYIPLNNSSTSSKFLRDDFRDSNFHRSPWQSNYYRPQNTTYSSPSGFRAPTPRFQRPSPYGGSHGNRGFNLRYQRGSRARESYHNNGSGQQSYNRYERPVFKNDISVYVPDSAFEDPWADFFITTNTNDTCCSVETSNTDKVTTT